MVPPSSGNAEQETFRHYMHGALHETLLAALISSGVDAGHLAVDDLATVDEFHTGGRSATVEFAKQMDLAPNMRLLDVGSGIGGPARYFASQQGCTVSGVDLSPEYCETATALSVKTGMDDRTNFRPGSANALPFPDLTFDGAYMLHVGMNISSKTQAFREVARVLKPGAVFGIFDMMRESDGELNFPVPWASIPDGSFVETAGSYRRYLSAAGFSIEKQRSRRDFALAFFAKMRETVAAAAASGGPPVLGLQILMGPTASLKIGNLMSMIERGILSPIEMIARKF